MACFDCDSLNDFDDDHRPGKPRRCTDLVCLALFGFFWFLLVFIAGFAFFVGNPWRLIHGSDSFGNVCGQKNTPVNGIDFSGMDMTDKPYLFHLNYSQPRNSLKICVRLCPDTQMRNQNDLYRFFINNGSKLCRYDYQFDSKLVGRNSPWTPDFAPKDTSPCPEHVPASSPVLYRCVPKDAISFGIAFGHTIYDFLLSYAPFKKIINDLVESYHEMSMMAVFAIFISFFTAFTIHFIASLASWIIMFVFSSALIVLTAFMWCAYFDVGLQIGSIQIEKKILKLSDDQNNDQIIFYLSIGITIVTTIMLLIVWVMRKRVKLVVALFQEAGACIRSMPMLLIQPFITLMALFIFFVFWLAVLLALATAEHAQMEQRQLKPWNYGGGGRSQSVFSIHGPQGRVELASFTLIKYEEASWIQYMWWYLIVAFIWTSQFILACQQMVIAGAVVQWYFTRDRSRLFCPIGKSFRRLVWYHLGSVALGSFLITLFIIPRIVITYLASKMRGYDNPCIKWSLRCCHCCLWLIERFVKYLNHNAYTIVAIEGFGFCTSAQIAFNTIVSNALRVTAINSVGDFILFLGKVGVTATTAFVGAFLLKNNPVLHYWTVPVIVVCFFSYWIAHCILSIYEMVIDTLFLCFCEDYNKNDGSPGHEYYAPPSLLKFLTGEEVDTALKQLRLKNGDRLDR